jgi:hypothetical protein
MPLRIVRLLTVLLPFLIVASLAAFAIYKNTGNEVLSATTRAANNATTAISTTTTTPPPPTGTVHFMAKSLQEWIDVYRVPPKCDPGYRMIEYQDNSDIFLDGQRSDAPAGLYCVHANVSVIRCNTATSRLVDFTTNAATAVVMTDRNERERWLCAPRWPDVFGGRDGGDIVVCGGSVIDAWTGLVHTGRLPSSAQMKPIEGGDPRTEQIKVGDGNGGSRSVYRWRCAGDGPIDHMGNRYLESPSGGQRLTKTRNECARFIYRAVSQIAPSADRPGYCDCLAKRDDSIRPPNSGQGTAAAAAGPIVSVPHECLPCVFGGGPDKGTYAVKLARGCMKSYSRPDSGNNNNGTHDVKDLFFNRFPCGTTSFNAQNASCVSGTAYVGIGMSEFVRRLIGARK